MAAEDKVTVSGKSGQHTSSRFTAGERHLIPLAGCISSSRNNQQASTVSCMLAKLGICQSDLTITTNKPVSIGMAKPTLP